jgi:hypothetical protein
MSGLAARTLVAAHETTLERWAESKPEQFDRLAKSRRSIVVLGFDYSLIPTRPTDDAGIVRSDRVDRSENYYNAHSGAGQPSDVEKRFYEERSEL